MSNKDALLQSQRKKFHRSLLDSGVMRVDSSGVPTNADRGNQASTCIALDIAHQLLAEAGDRQPAQTSGSKFEALVKGYIEDTFPKLQHLRPGNWRVIKLGNRGGMSTSDFAQYEHLAYLSELTRENTRLSTILGNDYMVAPDIVVYRELYTDEELNAPIKIVGDKFAQYADLRLRDGGKPILHASVSAKWTMRSDRAQNSRTEALNLIRNRKGSLPHIVVVTGEPLPSRIASLALGTGDIDCVYHFALNELCIAVNNYGNPFVIETLDSLIEGKRLKDISDLPLDLCV